MENENKDSNRALITFVVTAIIIVLLGIIFYQSDGKKITTGTNDKESIAILKNNYMSECISPDSNYSYCSCAFDNLIEREGLAGFIKLSLEYQRTNIEPDTLIKASAECLYLNK